MNDKRAALSVAATGLLGVGIALILFTSGAALGWLSITVGILIGARAVAELRRGGRGVYEHARAGLATAARNRCMQYHVSNYTHAAPRAAVA